MKIIKTRTNLKKIKKINTLNQFKGFAKTDIKINFLLNASLEPCRHCQALHIFPGNCLNRSFFSFEPPIRLKFPALFTKTSPKH